MTDEKDEAMRLMGEIQGLLNHQFLLTACKGGMLKDATPSLMADFAIAVAKDETNGIHLPSVDAMTCHDVLCSLIREGFSLPKALSLGRHHPLGAPAFEREQMRDLEELERQQLQSHGVKP